MTCCTTTETLIRLPSTSACAWLPECHPVLCRLDYRRYVLLSITFFARRDELWGRFLGAPSGSGGLSIRLPPVGAPATTAENRQHRLRLCRYVKPPRPLPSGRGHPAEGDASKARRALARTHRIGSEELVRGMVGRTAGRWESNTREGNCSPGSGTPWAPTQPIRQAFLSGSLVGTCLPG